MNKIFYEHNMDIKYDSLQPHLHILKKEIIF